MQGRMLPLHGIIGLALILGLHQPDEALGQSRKTFRRVQDATSQNRPRAKAGPRTKAGKRGAGQMNAFVQRLMQTPPDSRRQMLADNPRYQRLPAAQKRAIEARLREFDRLPAGRREMLVQRYQLFSRLGPQQQSQARTLFREWSRLPAPRRTRITQAVRRLRSANADQRAEIMASERYSTAFDQQDRKLIEELLELTPAEGAEQDAAPGRDRPR